MRTIKITENIATNLLGMELLATYILLASGGGAPIATDIFRGYAQWNEAGGYWIIGNENNWSLAPTEDNSREFILFYKYGEPREDGETPVADVVTRLRWIGVIEW